MSLTVFSQTGSKTYPKTVSINGESVTQFYTWQAVELAKDVSLKKYFRDIYFLTEDQLEKCKVINDTKDSINVVQEEKISMMFQVEAFKDSIIMNKDLMLDSKDVIIKSYKKKAKSKKIRNWFATTGAIVLTSVLTVIVGK
jgi:hypothetical protein